MKLPLLVFFALAPASLFAQTMTEVFQPPYVASGRVPENRIQTVSRYTVAGLNPNATYRYTVGYERPTGSGPGAGGFWVINGATDGSAGIDGYAGTGTKNLTGEKLQGKINSKVASYGEFITDASGAYTGWFAGEGSGNSARFTPGQQTAFVLQINDGAGGGDGTFLKADKPVTALGQDDPGTAPDSGTFIVGDTKGSVPPESIVLLYNAESGGELVWGTWVESTGISPPAPGPTSAYAQHVTEGRWAAYVPNDMAEGVRRVEYYSPAGKLIGTATSPTGVWKSLPEDIFLKAKGDTTFDGGMSDLIGIEAPIK